MTRNPCRGWKNGDPVTLVSNGRPVALGTARVWRVRDTGRLCVKVQYNHPHPESRWVWPEGWVLGQGDKSAVCLECDQFYFTSNPKDAGFCPACDREFNRDVAADSGIRKPRAYLRGARTPAPKAKQDTAEELATIAAIKAKDKEESPFG